MAFFGKPVRGPPQINLIWIEGRPKGVFLEYELYSACYSNIIENRVI